jgi:hypothetical protein
MGGRLLQQGVKFMSLGVAGDLDLLPLLFACPTNFFQIPPDLVVKTQAIDIFEVIL